MDSCKAELYAPVMNDETHTIGARIRKARSALGLTQQALADRLNISVQSVSQWETDRTRPHFDRLWLLEELLGLPYGWLVSGEGEMIQDPPKRHDGHEEFRNRLARKLAWDETLSNYGRFGIETPPYEIEPGSILATHEAQGDLFSIEIEDSSNSPIFEIGDIVIGDTGTVARPGDMVFAKLSGRTDVIFRQIKSFRRDEDGKLTANLKPINDDYESEVINLSDDYDRIIGVMVEHRRFRRR